MPGWLLVVPFLSRIELFTGMAPTDFCQLEASQKLGKYWDQPRWLVKSQMFENYIEVILGVIKKQSQPFFDRIKSENPFCRLCFF